MADLTYSEYWTEVKSLAEEAAKECGYDTDAGREWVWETVDGHQWIIYTAYNFDVLKLSPNDGYTVENFGPDGIADGGSMDWAKLAFGALYADVMGAYDALEAPEDSDEDAA